ncbi:uncharacterized protein LOC134695479 [Mytilus trossulus]|uniref:uncharacterized protein LOC134695479 n=1 Tax=Mytilus trossulus TaxID=6551 RepID=UPI003005FAE6
MSGENEPPTYILILENENTDLSFSSVYPAMLWLLIIWLVPILSRRGMTNLFLQSQNAPRTTAGTIPQTMMSSTVPSLAEGVTSIDTQMVSVTDSRTPEIVPLPVDTAKTPEKIPSPN